MQFFLNPSGSKNRLCLVKCVRDLCESELGLKSSISHSDRIRPRERREQTRPAFHVTLYEGWAES